MKKILLSGMLFLGLGANAQLADGSIAPDFTLTDVNGTSHNLYTYLDAGYTVFIDVSATWCGPCWSYHNTNALEDLWVAHGPTGGTSVSGGTTDDVIVLFIEGDGSTTSADLNGTGSNTQGDWVTGVSHPVIDPASSAATAFNNDYAIGYFPTIYKICTSRQIYEVGQATAANLYASVADCPVASGVNNPGLIGYAGETSSCDAIDVIVDMQNLGSGNLTAATLVLKQGSTVLNTYNWTGNLATYGIASVTVGQVTPTAPTTYTIEITSADDVTSNNTLTQELSSAPAAATASITVQITTDAYGSETTWTLTNGVGTTVASGGPYSDLSAAGTTAQTPVTYSAPTADDCYTLTVNDSYGDGMDAGYGSGSYTVTDGSANVLVTGGVFTDVATGKFKSGSGGSTGGINELTNESFKVFPNPASDKLTVSFDAENADYTIAVLDLTGRTVVSNNYSNLAGSQEISVPVSDLSTGNYIVKISTNGVSFNQKVVIK